MAYPSVTYSFSNLTTASALEVNQNFSDLINGMSDGSKDFYIAALTADGNFQANANVILGNSSTDQITISGSIAADILLLAQFSYDIGTAANGLKDVYFGSADSAAYSTKIRNATITDNRTFTLPAFDYTNPTSDGNPYDSLGTNGSGQMIFYPTQGVLDMMNVGLQVEVNNALGTGIANGVVIRLKQADGSTDCTSTAPAIICFRNSTLTTGGVTRRACTQATAVNISAGSTAGRANGDNFPIYIYAIDFSGTIELAWSRMYFTNETELHTTTAEGGAGGADDNGTLYSTTLRSNVPLRLIGRFISTQATAGTWVTAATEISVGNRSTIPREIVKAVYQSSLVNTLTDDTEERICCEVSGEDNYNAVSFTSYAAQDWRFKSPKDTDYTVIVRGTVTPGENWAAGDTGYLQILVSGTKYDDLYCRGEIGTTEKITINLVSNIYMFKDEELTVVLKMTTGTDSTIAGHEITITEAQYN